MNEKHRIAMKKLKDEQIEERKKLFELSLEEKDQNKQKIYRDRSEEHEKREIQMANVLRKKYEIDTQKSMEDYKKITFKRNNYLYL